MIKTLKGIEVHREFEPDMKRMVHALEVLLFSIPKEEIESPKQEEEDDLLETVKAELAASLKTSPGEK